MQGLEAALSYLWEEGREEMTRRHCLPLAHASCPPLRLTSVYTADTAWAQDGLARGPQSSGEQLAPGLRDMLREMRGKAAPPRLTPP